MQRTSFKCDNCEKETDVYPAELKAPLLTWKFDLCYDCLHKGAGTLRALWARIVEFRKWRKSGDAARA